MNTICLFGRDYDSAKSVHIALRALLNLPDYYGGNADALNDCLGELPVCPGLWIRREGTEEVQRTLERIARVFADNGGIIKEI